MLLGLEIPIVVIAIMVGYEGGTWLADHNCDYHRERVQDCIDGGRSEEACSYVYLPDACKEDEP